MTDSPHPALFDALPAREPDSLLSIIAAHRDDPRPDKIDLGVGVYRDDAMRTPVMRSVKEAERRLLAEQDSKSYLGSDGDARFTALLADLVLGEALARSDRLTGVQTPGGTGALRLGAEIVQRARPGAKLWLGTPSWPNHAPLFKDAGLVVEHFPFFDRATVDLDFGMMMDALGRAAPGDVVLLQSGCHNPTGAQFSIEQWATLAELMATRGLLPFIDLAYHGLGDGLDADAAPARLVLERLPEAVIAYSCDKNFAVYRERVGALWVQAANPHGRDLVRATMLGIARCLWSMPPDHGAAAVRIVLDDADLRADWRVELDGMRARLNAVRAELAAAHPRLAPIGRQRGFFALLPLSPDQVLELRDRHGIYMAGSGRMSVAGLNAESLPRFVAALRPYLD